MLLVQVYFAAMEQPKVYNYSDPQSFLRDSLGYKCAKNPGFSVRAWARLMGLKAHATLVFLLNGQRGPPALEKHPPTHPN